MIQFACECLVLAFLRKKSPGWVGVDEPMGPNVVRVLRPQISTTTRQRLRVLIFDIVRAPRGQLFSSILLLSAAIHCNLFLPFQGVYAS